MILIQIILGVFCLSVVVLVHEAGHYIASRMRGIKVLTFSIGFGPRLFGLKRYGTDFRFSLIPLGGYCRFYGEEEFQKAMREKRELEVPSARSFYGASPFSRIIVSLWGPMANVVFSFIIFFLISLIGYEEFYIEPRILLASNWNENKRTWPADEAGLKDGDIFRLLTTRKLNVFLICANIIITRQIRIFNFRYFEIPGSLILILSPYWRMRWLFWVL